MLFQSGLKVKDFKKDHVIFNNNGNSFDFFLPYLSLTSPQKIGSLIFLKRENDYFLFYILTPRGNFKFYCNHLRGLSITNFKNLNLFLFRYFDGLKGHNNTNFNLFSTFCKILENLLFTKYSFCDFIIKGETYEAYLLDSQTLSVHIGFTHNLAFKLPELMAFRNFSDELQLLFRLYGPNKLLVMQTLYKIKLLKKRDNYNGLGIYSLNEGVKVRLSKKVLKKNKT